MICEDEQLRWIKQREEKNTSTAQPRAKHKDLGRKPYNSAAITGQYVSRAMGAAFRISGGNK